MLGLIFSLDYEIYGTGQGDFSQLMLDPTSRLLNLFDQYGAKLTIMSDVAEIMALKRHDSFQSTLSQIEDQLIQAIKRDHDVQLHIHPAWSNAYYDGNRWILDFDEYGLAGLPYERIDLIIRQGKEYLESLLQSVKSALPYRCTTFRAGNWLMQPSGNIVRALENNGIVFDTSVYKWGRGDVGKYQLDYRVAHSNIFPWVVAAENINQQDDTRQGLMEIPILTRKVFITSMLSWKRINLQLRLRRGNKNDSTGDDQELGGGKKAGSFHLMHAKKFDFCRLTFREMKSFLTYAEKSCQNTDAMVPIVAIGHSTEFYDSEDLERFLAYVSQLGPGRVAWTTFNELTINQTTRALSQLEKSSFAKIVNQVQYD